ncbi:hypothetical protein BS17DRAFT_773837 [Gyrodon lividus]|nr:hypothetical protein BS17DRAFT_773837 [Gyrodon lividus]
MALSITRFRVRVSVCLPQPSGLSCHYSPLLGQGNGSAEPQGLSVSVSAKESLVHPFLAQGLLEVLVRYLVRGFASD